MNVITKLRYLPSDILNHMIYGPADQSDGNNRTFNHARAQKYELFHSNLWAERSYHIYANAERAVREKLYWSGPDNIWANEFFNGDLTAWDQFAKGLTDKTFMEIGGGPLPALSYMWYANHRIEIDPLIDEYREIAVKRGHGSLFNFIMLSICAEDIVSDLDGKVDGLIVCHNALDHGKEPYTVLDNIAKYAAPGCNLLLWSDLYHPKGHDEGHTNITKDKREFKNEIQRRGFDIIYDFELKHRPSVNYGCRAIKQ